MARKWTSFDSRTTNRELLSIPQPDRGALMLAMGRYRGDLPGGFAVKSYGDGLYMIKSTNASSGRCLFFTVHRSGGIERLVALLFYKKESDEAPTRLITAARERRGRYLEER